MKPVYKCDYCSFVGTEEEVKEHEPNCTENYDMRSCHTCKNRGRVIFKEDGMNKMKYECEAGKDIPEGCVINYCNLYEQKEKSLYGDLVRSMFGGF